MPGLREYAEKFGLKSISTQMEWSDLDDLARKIHDQWRTLGLRPESPEKIRADLDKPQFFRAIRRMKRR